MQNLQESRYTYPCCPAAVSESLASSQVTETARLMCRLGTQCIRHGVIDRRGQAFQEVMPLAMRNLAIAQQRDKEWYRLVRGGGWDRPKVDDYVLFKQKTKHTLDVPTRPHILRVVGVKGPQLEKVPESGWKYSGHSSTYLSMAIPLQVKYPKF